MTAIQSGSDWWVNSVARFPGGGIGGDFPGGAMNLTYVPPAGANAYGSEDDVSSSSISSATSDIEEEGELSPIPQNTDPHTQPVELAAEQIDTNGTEMKVSQEIIAAAARRIGVVEAAMRQHQATGVLNFDDDDDESGEDPTDKSSKHSMLQEMLQDPSKAFAAIMPGQDRPGLLALLTPY